MADAVEHHLGDRALPVESARSPLVIDGGGQAIERAGAVGRAGTGEAGTGGGRIGAVDDRDRGVDRHGAVGRETCGSAVAEGRASARSRSWARGRPRRRRRAAATPCMPTLTAAASHRRGHRARARNQAPVPPQGQPTPQFPELDPERQSSISNLFPTPGVHISNTPWSRFSALSSATSAAATRNPLLRRSPSPRREQRS